jgi:hypothetical protein
LRHSYWMWCQRNWIPVRNATNQLTALFVALRYSAWLVCSLPAAAL